MATGASVVLDRVPEHVESAVADASAAMLHFGDGDLHTAGLRLRRARESINQSIKTIQRRGH